jgi:hypothetical protein
MPSSAQLQLIARGNQDAFLTTNPQFTFFRYVYRRYTPFSIESIPIDFDGNCDFGKRISVIVPRCGELLSSLFIEVELPPLPQADPANPTYWVNDVAYALIKDISIEIGDKEINKHTGEWLKIWGDLTIPKNHIDGYNEMIGHWDVYPPAGIDVTQPLRLTIPLKFWFCNTIGAALPLIALQSHPVRIIAHLRPLQELWWNDTLPVGPGQPCPTITPVSISRFQMFGDYVYLDTEERRVFAASKHEYLIDQLQIAPRQSIAPGISSFSEPLNFNHCCKEFIWVIQETRMAGAREWFNFSNLLQYGTGETGIETDLLATMILRLDGYDRFYVRSAPYFRLTQPLQHHTNIPDSRIYLYSFSLRPEDNQPSGSINCSKIDDIVMGLTFNPNELDQVRTIQVYATNYNVLRIEGGMGGLMFIA